MSNLFNKTAGNKLPFQILIPTSSIYGPNGLQKSYNSYLKQECYLGLGTLQSC